MLNLRQIAKRIIKLASVALISCLIVAIIRASLIRPPPKLNPCSKSDHDYISDGDRGFSKRLSDSIRFETVSTNRHEYNRTELKKFIDYIQKVFPKVHSSPLVQLEVVNNLSLLYTVEGSDPSLQPYLLAAHLDVVPVDREHWNFDPFGGEIKDGHIYGRGTIDNKANLMGIFEALEFMIERKMHPKRSFFIALGHDEEVNGIDGARIISQMLNTRGIKLKYLLDEGSFILHNLITGVPVPIGLVGVTEKGYLTLKLVVNTPGGHSSIPPKETSIGILSNALSKLNGNTQPNLFGYGTEIEMFKQLAPYANFPMRVILGNLWLFSPIVSWFYSLDPISNNNIRSTTAVTMIGGGFKENVVPNSAWGIVNHRVHPYQTIEDVIRIDREIINDERVSIEVLHSMEPHPISPHDGDTYGYQTIKNTIMQLYPEVAITPLCMVANTDTRWYLNLTDQIYRFSVFSMDKKELSMIHGHNERISLDSYERVVNFYYHLIKNSDSDEIPRLKVHTEL